MVMLNSFIEGNFNAIFIPYTKQTETEDETVRILLRTLVVYVVLHVYFISTAMLTISFVILLTNFSTELSNDM